MNIPDYQEPSHNILFGGTPSDRNFREALFIDGPLELHIRSGTSLADLRLAFSRIQTYVAIYLANKSQHETYPPIADLG